MWHNVKILSVDDSNFIRMQIKKIFNGYNVEMIEAENGVVGLEKVKLMPDLILLDITMPVMDGLTMLNKLREDPLYSKIPVVMVSAELTSAVMIKMAKAGSNNYVPKPFTPKILISKVKAILKNKLLTFDDRIAILQREAKETFYTNGNCLVVSFPNLEPDVIMNIAGEFPERLEAAIKNGVSEVFVNLLKLNNVDVVSVTCLRGLVSASEARGLRSYVVGNGIVKNQLSIYPGTEKWSFHHLINVTTNVVV